MCCSIRQARLIFKSNLTAHGGLNKKIFIRFSIAGFAFRCLELFDKKGGKDFIQQWFGPRELGHPVRRITDLILVVNIVIYALDRLFGNALTIMGAKVNKAILKGQFWRVFTSSILHGDLLHLFLNCISIDVIGPELELIVGSGVFLLVYTFSTAM